MLLSLCGTCRAVRPVGGPGGGESFRGRSGPLLFIRVGAGEQGAVFRRFGRGVQDAVHESGGIVLPELAG